MMTKTATDWIAYLEAEPRSEPHLSIAAALREQASMLQRAHSIISVREAAYPSAKGRAWLTQYEITDGNPDEPGARQLEPFVVKHYASDERPSIKGNGFDGLQIGEDRQDAEDFVKWLNERLGVNRGAE